MLHQMSVCSVGNQGSHKQRKGIFTGEGVDAVGRGVRRGLVAGKGGA